MFAHKPIAFLAILVSASSFAAAADETYPVKLDRPFKPGDAYDMHAILDTKTTTTTSAPGRDPTVQEESMKADLTARVDIAAVDPRGNEKDFTVTIRKFTLAGDNKDAVEVGKVIEVKRTTQNVSFTLRGGGDLPAKTMQVLGMYFDKLNSTGVTNGDIFGTNTPRKVGESWPLSSEMAAKQASDSNIVVDPKNIAGETTLKGVEKAGAGPALRVISSISLTDAKPSRMPPNRVLSTYELKSQINSLYPTDSTLPSMEDETTVDSRIVILAIPPESLRSEIKNHLHESLTITLVKK